MKALLLAAIFGLCWGATLPPGGAPSFSGQMIHDKPLAAERVRAHWPPSLQERGARLRMLGRVVHVGGLGSTTARSSSLPHFGIAA